MAKTDNSGAQAKRGLGRGLSVLMGNLGVDAASATETGNPEKRRDDDERAIESGESTLKRPGGSGMSVPIELIRVNPGQPREDFGDEDLEELARSIRRNGMIQPLIVRRDPSEKASFQIIAGERRWRAAQRARLHEVPVVVRETNEQHMLEIALVENIQRTDLNPIEEARGFRQLIDEFEHTQASLAEVVGKSRSHIANSVRLLALPGDVQALLREGKISAGHARALLGCNDPSGLARRIVAEGLNVRQTEDLAARASGEKKGNHRRPKDADTRALEAELSASLKLRVAIQHKSKGKGGALRISYRSLDELDALCRILRKPRDVDEADSSQRYRMKS